MKPISTFVVECLLDLGVTVIYASLAGLMIGAVTLSDGGLEALTPALAYAALLPLAVVALIVSNAVLRTLGEARADRRPRCSTQCSQMRRALPSARVRTLSA